MPTVSQAVQFLEDVTDVPPATIKAVARKLLDDDLLPKSSGKRIAQIDLRHFARLLLAVYATRTVREASEVAVRYATMSQPQGHFFRPRRHMSRLEQAVFERALVSRGFTAEECIALTIAEIIGALPLLSPVYDDVIETKISINLSHPEVVYSNVITSYNEFEEDQEYRIEKVFFTVTFSSGSLYSKDVWANRPARLVQLPFGTFLAFAQMWLDLHHELREKPAAQRVAHLMRTDEQLTEAVLKAPDSAPVRVEFVDVDPPSATLAASSVPSAAVQPVGLSEVRRLNAIREFAREARQREGLRREPPPPINDAAMPADGAPEELGCGISEKA